MKWFDSFLVWLVRNQPIPAYAMIPKLPERIASIAESKVGLHESGGANKGPQIQEFFNADNYDPNGPKPGDDGYAWCAAFICRILQLAMEGGTYTFQRPVTPSAYGFEKWSLAQDKSTQTRRMPGMDLKRGDLVIYTFSHIGICVSPPDKFGRFKAVEGNTNEEGSREGDGVYLKTRRVSQVRSRIRFTV